MKHVSTIIRIATAVTLATAMTAPTAAQRQRHLLMNEQGTIQVRERCTTPAVPNLGRPPTVADTEELPVWQLSLDEAIEKAMTNTDVVRVLSGVGAASSGQTIYSPAISNAGIDQARAEFDPRFTANNSFSRNESSTAIPDIDPTRSVITGSRRDGHDFTMDLSKKFLNGANTSLGVGTDWSRNPLGGSLNPQTRSNVSLSVTQPLLRGRGLDANSVPTVLAFIDTERSYFRLKQGLQNTVQGVIQGYWDLVQARTELWVIEQQIRAGRWANDFNERRLEVGGADISEVAQSRASLANFQASRIATRANILNRIAALRGIMGMPPGSDFTIVPVTKPLKDPLEFDWEALLELAESNRPDIVELQLVLDADRQRLLLAHNQARPQLDAGAFYSWNGLEGKMPIGERLESGPGEFTSWSLQVNFSVPLTLRSERASLRQNELLLASDQANLRQRLLEVSHEIAFTLRIIAQLNEQYQSFHEAREAAEKSLEYQVESYRAGVTTFLDFLLAVNTWASSVTNEAQAITQLNSTLATLEYQTGTILETHGIRLFEERYCSLGPLGRIGKGRMFPAAIRPSANDPRYQNDVFPSEEAFQLSTPSQLLETKDN